MTPEQRLKLSKRLGEEAELEVAALFGSAVAGRLRPDSDIDVYVRLWPGCRWDLSRRLALSADLSGTCGRDVDLVVEDESTSVILRRQVAAHGRPLHEARPGAWVDLRAKALVAYADLEPYMRRIGQAIREAAMRRG